MSRLSALDAAFLRVERDVQPVHVGFVLLLRGPAPSTQELTALVADRVPARLHRVADERPGSRPRWREVDVDARRHVRARPLEVPGDEALQDAVGEVMADALPRDRPLWDVTLVPDVGPEDDPEGGGPRWAVVVRAHHAVVDGLAGVDALLELLDPDPASPPPPTPSVGAGAVRRPSVARLLAGTASLARAVAVPERVLSGELSTRRRWRWVRGDLDLARQVAREHDATVNDVVLACVTGGLRELLLARGVDPRGVGLRSLVPVSLRAPDERAVAGNLVSGVVARLPVGEADPSVRVRLVAEQLRALKGSAAPLGPVAVLGVAERTPEPVAAALVRAVARWPRGWTATATTNVPGPSRRRSIAGRPLLEAFPYIPLGQRMRVTVGILSYAGTLSCGVTGDGVHLPEVDVVADGVRAAWTDLGAGIIGA